MKTALRLTPLLLAVGLALSAPAFAAEDPAVAQLTQRLMAIQANPDASEMAAYERLQAQQAIANLANAKRRDLDQARYLADRRVEIAETSVRAALAKRELSQLERTRSDLLIEASRRDAQRARQESERLRVQAQIQAEEAERLRLAADQEAQARAEAEGLLDNVAGQQAAKLRAARERDAELARKEAELMGEAPPKPAPKPKPKKK